MIAIIVSMSVGNLIHFSVGGDIESRTRYEMNPFINRILGHVSLLEYSQSSSRYAWHFHFLCLMPDARIRTISTNRQYEHIARLENPCVLSNESCPIEEKSTISQFVTVARALFLL